MSAVKMNKGKIGRLSLLNINGSVCCHCKYELVKDV